MRTATSRTGSGRCVSAALVLALAAGCGGSAAAVVRPIAVVSDRSVDYIDAQRRVALTGYCVATAYAKGRRAHLAAAPERPGGERCVDDGPDAPPAGPAAPPRDPGPTLLEVRARWAPVLRAAEAVARAQRSLAAVLEVVRRFQDQGPVLAALGDLAEAYAELRGAQNAAGLPVAPPLPLNPPEPP